MPMTEENDMAEKAGRKERNPEDKREKRSARGSRVSRRQSTKNDIRRRRSRAR